METILATLIASGMSALAGIPEAGGGVPLHKLLDITTTDEEASE